ncbi:MAG TPA: secondary thiamine-phosphate synthase enzyme YjbQ [Candidatus Limnocylindria bacterium]|nr:secondary thiamine-phosphate synthase enzyme YjbQ [Candidatus Limnocylindria bacterium]
MSTTHLELRIETTKKTETIDITDRVAEKVKDAKIAEGICVVTVAHTTAGVFVNENADPDVQRDLLVTLARLVPDQGDYRHAEGNGPAHIKSVLVGSDITVAIENGGLALGRWQGIYLAEFDGPRTRSAAVTVIGDRPG